MRKIIFMATLALLATACQPNKDGDKTPITKPQITIEGGRFTPEALWAMGRINSVLPNESTGQIAYTVSYYSVKENRSTSWIRIAKEEDGKLVTINEFVGYEPSWIGDKIAYLKAGKLYLPKKQSPIANLHTCLEGFDKDIEGYLLSPQGDKIILIAQVKTVASTEDKYPDLPLASGRVVNDLMYKHWDEWTETAPHPFLCKLKNVKGKTIVTDCIDLLEGTPYESPMKPFGGVEQLAWSPDGKTIAYTCRKKSGLDYAVSTNSDIYLYDLATGTHTNLTEGNGGYDTNPSYSPDGQWIAWQSMERDGYESDENRLMICHLTTGERRFLTQGMETNVDAYYWKDNNTLVFSAVWHATSMLYQVNLQGQRQCLTTGQYDYVPGGNIGNTYYCLRHSMREANEIFRFQAGEEPQQISNENENIYSQIEMGTVVPRWQKTTDKKDMLTWVIYPPHFDPSKKYPTLLYCEGGPQSPVSQFWSYRWNFQIMAANGYIIIAPNRRGLPGFGLEWNEEISTNYGGNCMSDLLTAIDDICKEPYVDTDRLGCVGASFGGYSAMWLAGHHEKRFKAFIAHDGFFNMEQQYYETEESWFPNWDLGGAPYEQTEGVKRSYSNSPHKFVDKWDTPILLIHGDRDYRILSSQSMAAFNAARLKGIPAQLLLFPDENHWVLKPQNGILWQRTFFRWLDRWLKK